MYGLGIGSDLEMIQHWQSRIVLAQHNAPSDVFTTVALVLVKAATTALIILLPLQMVSTAIGGCLIALTFGVLSIILSIIWLPFLGLLLGTSWLWLRVWYLRPILLIPGVAVAILATVYVMLAPDPERDAKYAKLSMAGEWPLSWFLVKPPF